MKKLIDCLKVGDKVFDIRFGWGVVNSLFADGEQFTPIEVVFKGGWTFFYTDEGKIEENNLNPSLFLNEIKLEQELPEFVEGEIVLANREKYCDVYGLYYDEWVVAIYKRYDKLTDTYICKNLGGQLDFVFDAVKSLSDPYFVK